MTNLGTRTGLPPSRARFAELLDRPQERAATISEPDKLGFVRACVSKRVPDRHGTLFLPSSFEKHLDKYRANPVVYYEHNFRSEPPCGRASNFVITDQEFLADIEFDLESERGAEIAGKYHRGFMRGFSHYFRIHAAVAEWSDEAAIAALPEDAREMLLRGDVWAVITECEIMEITCCGIPSCPEALKRSEAGSELERLSARIDSLEQAIESERQAREELETALSFWARCK